MTKLELLFLAGGLPVLYSKNRRHPTRGLLFFDHMHGIWEDHIQLDTLKEKHYVQNFLNAWIRQERKHILRSN